MSPQPDPCATGCIMQSFGPYAHEWWEIFVHCSEQWTDDRKQAHYKIDYPAIDVIFRAYGVEDYREGLETLRIIADELSDVRAYSDEWIFGLTEDEVA